MLHCVTEFFAVIVHQPITGASHTFQIDIMDLPDVFSKVK